MLLFNIALLVVGFILLIRGADQLVNGASSLAMRLGVSELIVGLTVVALGTSMPEFVVNMFAVVQGTTDIAIGNVIGSNIANIALVLGISSLILPLTVQTSLIWREIPFALLIAFLLGVFTSDRILDGAASDMLGRADGISLLAFTSIFLYYVVSVARHSRSETEVASVEGPRLTVWKAIWYVALGITLLVVGGKFVVDGATAIALSYGLSQKLIGLTIVAVGTSLPELVTSVVAVLKKQTDIGVGNVVGSNILNIILILGTSAVVRPLPFAASSQFDVIVMLAFTFLLYMFMYVGKKHELERWQGATLVVGYMAYVGYLITQG